jgi:hypothetical protein
LGGTVLLSGVRVFWVWTIFVTVLGGLGVWLFAGAFTNHIGVSGVSSDTSVSSSPAGAFEKSFRHPYRQRDM